VTQVRQMMLDELQRRNYSPNYRLGPHMQQHPPRQRLRSDALVFTKPSMRLAGRRHQRDECNRSLLGRQQLRKEGRIGLRLANAIRYLGCRAQPLRLTVFRT
jgi:hypothetical protein